jgi:ABC-type nitrate/sulfonate/bicarbonate transport system substrate-binding protein
MWRLTCECCRRAGPVLLLIATLIVPDQCSAAPLKIRLGIGGAAEDTLFLLLARPDLTPNQGKLYTVEATRFEGTDKRFQAFEAGALDITVMNANGALFAAAEGIQFKFIASLSRESSKGAFTKYMVLDSAPIKSVADLKGRTIGINSLSSQSELAVNIELEKSGLHENDVRIVPIPFPAQGEALKSGLVDLGSFPQPFAAIVEHQGGVRMLFSSKDAVPYDEELVTLIAKHEFLQDNRAAVEAFLADLVRCTKYYIANTLESRKALNAAKLVGIDPDIYYGMPDYFRDPGGRVDIEALKRMQEMQVSAGFQKTRADISNYVDLSYLPQ